MIRKFSPGKLSPQSNNDNDNLNIIKLKPEFINKKAHQKFVDNMFSIIDYKN